MTALEGKTVIKEEVPDKEVYDTTVNTRRHRIPNKDNCRTPDSPESARAIAPRSPISPQIHHSNSLAPPCPNRNTSSSPVINGATTTPPPQPAANVINLANQIEQTRALCKIRKLLGSLVQYTQENHPEISERVRALAISIASGGITIEEFRNALQEVMSMPFRPFVITFLKTHLPLLQREITAQARLSHQTILQYITNNENNILEFNHGPTDCLDLFLPGDNATHITNTSNYILKRRISDTNNDQHNNTSQDWDYIYPQAKRTHATTSGSVTNHIFGTHPSIFDYQGTSLSQNEGFSVILDKSNHRDDRDSRCSETQRNNRNGGEEEWKNIHTMLNCISGMVDKTKRAITILQQRGLETAFNYSDTSVVEIRRQAEEKVTELKRNAEEAVNQVKRQAVLEIQRAVAAAETRAADVMAQERLKMEKFFVEMSKHSNESDVENKSPSISTGQNACWNCGRKANETCSGCNMARYCGAFCQHKDWEHHHQICGNARTDITPTVVTKHAPHMIRTTNISRSPPTVTPTAIAQTSQNVTLPNGLGTSTK